MNLSNQPLLKMINHLLDRSTLFPAIRWAVFSIILLLSLYRIITYRCLNVLIFAGFYMVYFVLQFFTPLGLTPSTQSNYINMDRNECLENIGEREEDRPLLRALNEFSLWKHLTGVTVATLTSTIFELPSLRISTPYLLGFILWLVWLAWEKHTSQV